MKRLLLVLPLILVLLLVGCNFVQVKVINLSFYIDGEYYTESTLSQYRKNGISLPTKEGYSLSEWYLDPAMTQLVNWNKIKTDTNLYSRWQREQATTLYSVTFYDDEGEEVGHCRAATVNDISYPVMPHLADADFVGWEGIPQVLNQDIEVYAIYVPVYTVTFLVEGVVYSTQRVREGSGAERPANPSKESDIFYTYAFTGWDQNFNDVHYNMEVKARFTRTAILYDVIFEQDDGSVIRSTASEYGDRIVPPNDPTKAPQDGV
ncbi:MAG: InlB B-repeat-containing protein, partial [Clostridia bacterium]|nr:InlB B-repeat-containing protein [Clostridia bacterium]